MDEPRLPAAAGGEYTVYRIRACKQKGDGDSQKEGTCDRGKAGGYDAQPDKAVSAAGRRAGAVSCEAWRHDTGRKGREGEV